MLSLFQVFPALTSYFMAHWGFFSDHGFESYYLLSLYLCSTAGVVHKDIEQFWIFYSAEHSEN